MKIAFAIVFSAAVILSPIWIPIPAAQGPPGPELRSTIPGAHREPNPEAARELNKADDRTRRGETQRALEAHLKAAELDTLSSVVFERLGVAFLADGQPREAFEAFLRATLLEPGSPSAYNRAGQVLLYHLGRPEGALAAFERARTLDPNYAPVYYSLHIYRLTRGELAEAAALIDVARKLAQTESENALFHGAQQSMLIAFGDYRKAETAIRQYSQMIPSDFRVYHTRSLVERILGMYEDAAVSLRFIQEGRRPQAVLLNDLGLVMRALGEADSARVSFERAWKLDPQAGEAGYNLALEALAARDTVKALTWLARVEERTPYWYPVPLLAGRIHRAQGRETMAARALEAAYRLNPLSPVTAAEIGREAIGKRGGANKDSLLVRAESLLLAGDMALAGHYSTRANVDPDLRGPALIQSTWSKVPTGAGHSVRVVQLEAAKEKAPDAGERVLAVVERELGNAHAHIGNWKDAREHLERAVELASNDLELAAPAVAQLADLYLEMGDIQAARELTKGIREPRDPALLSAMAAVAAARGENAAAEEFRRQRQAAAYLPYANSSTNQKPN